MLYFLSLLVLLVLSGFFSGSETALTSLSMARSEALRKDGRRGAEKLYRLKQDTSRMLITILIGNNVVNIAASALATVIATEAFGHFGPGIAVGLLTIIILIFGEITPKSIAARHSEYISLLVAPAIYTFMRLIFPLVWLFQLFTDWLQKHAGAKTEPSVTETELITMAEHGERDGIIETDEREMIERVFNFNDLKAEDVMTPRKHVLRLDGRLSVEQLLPEILKNTFTRIPLYQSNQDEITGILILRDILSCVNSGQIQQQAIDIAQKPLYTPVNTPIDKLIIHLQRNKRYMAIVVDEYGSMIGVVTLEDIIEELVGEIYDETDQLPEGLMILDDNRVLVDGATELRVIEHYFSIDLPGKPTDTINRWILGHIERIANEGEYFEFDGFQIKIQNASSRRVRQVTLQRQ